MSSEGVKLEWALESGAPFHVSKYAATPPPERPHLTCPECLQTVIARCGEQRAHHFGHKVKASECAASQGEGALHLNAKYTLASELNRSLRFLAPCASSYCNALLSESAHPPLAYDQVKVEYCYGKSFRADIAILKEGALIATFEVYVTHRCEEEKISYHKATQLPCFEIEAESALRWKSDFEYFDCKLYGGSFKALCQTCDARRQEDARQAELDRLAEQEMRREIERDVRRAKEREKAAEFATQGFREFFGGRLISTTRGTLIVVEFYRRPDGHFVMIASWFDGWRCLSHQKLYFCKSREEARDLFREWSRELSVKRIMKSYLTGWMLEYAELARRMSEQGVTFQAGAY